MNSELSFHVENKIIQDTKFFVFKEKRYPIDFDLLKKNSQYFYRNRKQFKQVNIINLLNSADESLIDISEETVEAFVASCCNQPCKIRVSDVIPLQYLSHKFEFIELIQITNKFIEENSDQLVLPSILFKSKLRPNNQRKSEQHNIPQNFYNTEKEEEIISTHLNEFVQKDELNLLPIPVLDRIFHQFSHLQKVPKMSNEMIDFLFKCLDKHGINASILFSYVDFGAQSIEVVNRLIHNYSTKFDFNMINSTLLKTTTQLTSEVTKMKEDFSTLFSEMKQRFDEQQEEIQKIKKEENERKLLLEEEMNKMREEIEKSKEKEKSPIQKIEEKDIKNDNQSLYNIFVKNLSGHYIQLQVQLSNTIKEIKEKICEKTGIKTENQYLLYSGKYLYESCTLFDYNIQRDSTIHLCLRISNDNSCINVRQLNGKNICIQYDKNDTIKNIKEKIAKNVEIPSNMQNLVFNGKKLDDENTLQYYDIYAGYTIFLIQKINL